MSDSLLPYFEAELRAIMALAGEFADANPVVADRLRMTTNTVDDPHVRRLLQGIAFLAARVHHRLDDELPLLTDALLELLCPHFLAPLPSMMTVRLLPRPESQGPAVVPVGTSLRTEPVAGERLRYRTTQAVTLWPIAIDGAKLASQPVQAPVCPHVSGVASVLRLSLCVTVPGLLFSSLEPDTLCLHLRGPAMAAPQLLELLCTSTLAIALAHGASDPTPTFLPPSALQHVGFEREEAVLPSPQRAFAGHRLMTEYFAFPEKFHYINLSGLLSHCRVHDRATLDVFVYLARAMPELERLVTEKSFVLGCTPAVNLFDQPAEPIGLDGTQSEWPIVPDSNRTHSLEVYSVESLSYSSPEIPVPHDVPHFQRLRPETISKQQSEGMSWLASRRPAPATLGGSEMRLMLRDPVFDPTSPADGVLSVQTLCLNRDLPAQLPFGNGHPYLDIHDATAPAGGAECLSPPTSTLRPVLKDRSAWRLISHLSLNHLGVSGEQAHQALGEMMRLHVIRDTEHSAIALRGLVAVTSKPGVARLPHARPGSFARGLDVSLVFDPGAWAPGGLYLLAAVLERFLRLQVSVNSFVRTSAYLSGREQPVASWPAHSGTRALI